MIGAVFLDGGMQYAKDFIYRFILSDLEDKRLFYDSKTTLQELVQGSSREELHYELVEERGPEHDKVFVVDVYVGREKIGSGSGRTKKAAEQQAAYEALRRMKNKGL